MLLANMSVAALIADAFPERALLRRHPPPNQRKLDEVSHLSNSLVRAHTRPTSAPSVVLGRMRAFQASHASGMKHNSL